MRTILAGLLICTACCQVARGESWSSLGGLLEDSAFAAQRQELARNGWVVGQRLVELYWEDRTAERPSELRSCMPWFPGDDHARSESIRTRFVFYGRGQHLLTLEDDQGIFRYPGDTVEPPSDAGCAFTGSAAEFHDLLMRARLLKQRGVRLDGNLFPTVFGAPATCDALFTDLSGLTWNDLLDTAHALLAMVDSPPVWDLPDSPGPLRARCAVLRYPKHPAESLATARTKLDPFYASLALGAMAAQSLSKDAERAAGLLMEAQQAALPIDHWTGNDATSMGYLFQLIPHYPEPQAEDLLSKSRSNLARWAADSLRKAHPMQVLAEVMMQLEPAEAATFLLDTVSQDHHYHASVNTIGRSLARRDLEDAWGLVQRLGKSARSRPAYYELAAAVLTEVALKDMEDALARAETFPEYARLMVYIKIGHNLLEDGELEKARSVVDRLTPLSAEIGELGQTVASLQARLAAATQGGSSRVEIGPEDIERFLQAPDQLALRRIMDARRIAFADQEQAIAFVEASWPFAGTVYRLLKGKSLPGLRASVWSGWRFLSRVSATAGDAQTAYRACCGVSDLQARIGLLLEAYEIANPLPEPVRKWPLGFHDKYATVIVIQASPASRPAE